MSSILQARKQSIWQELSTAHAEGVQVRHDIEDNTDSTTSTIIVAITKTINVAVSSSTLAIDENNPDFSSSQFDDISGGAMADMSSSTDTMFLTSLVTGLTSLPSKSLDQFNSMSMISQPASASSEQPSLTSSMVNSAAELTISSFVSGSGLDITLSPTSTGNLQPATIGASPVTTVAHATSNNEPHGFTPKDITTPIIAGVVPTVAVLLLIVLLLWYKHSKKVRRQQEDLEREGFRTTDHSPRTNERRHDSHTQVEQTKSSPNASIKQTSYDHICESPGKLIHPRIRPAGLDLCAENRAISEDGIPEDPFLTPTDQKAFSPNIHDSPRGCSESQIGLAVTTSYSGNVSDDSSTKSVDTVLHHASAELPDPFQDPKTTHSAETPTQPESPITSPISGMATNPTVQSPSNNAQQPIVHQPTLTKSPTPPEELARRWIEVLKLEAAQAQQAAEDAARRARELKMEFEQNRRASEENIKVDSDGDSDSSDDDNKTITA